MYQFPEFSQTLRMTRGTLFVGEEGARKKNIDIYLLMLDNVF